MSFKDVELKNPYTKPNPLSKPLYSPSPKPTTTTVGGVTVNTTKPVIFETTTGVAPGVAPGATPVQGDVVVERGDEPKLGFWASKSRKQKTIIIAGGIAILAVVYFAFKKK